MIKAMKPYLSVIIPSFNEEKNFQRGVLDSVVEYLGKQKYSWEVILSDDGSTDNTPKLLDDFAKKHSAVTVLHNDHGGKAPTVSAGMLKASGEWRLFTDFDQSTPLSEVEKLFAWKEDYLVIIGSREISGALRDKEPFHRHIMGKGFNLVVQTLTVRGIQDTQCGFKLFNHVTIKSLFNNLYVYGPGSARKDAFTGALDVELLYLAHKYGFPIKEVPIFWKHNPTDRVNPLKDSVRMFKDVLRIRIADWQGKYAINAKT